MLKLFKTGKGSAVISHRKKICSFAVKQFCLDSADPHLHFKWQVTLYLEVKDGPFAVPSNKLDA